MSSLAFARSASRTSVAHRLSSGKIVADGATSVHARLSSKRGLFTIIHQGHEGWRLTLGRDPVHLEPGLRLKIPLIHSVMELDMRECSVQVPTLPGYTADNVPVTCSGSLFYRINDSYKASFAVSEVHENIAKIGQSAMRSVLGSFTYDQVISDRNDLNQQLNKVIGNSISNWGVDCTRFEVQSFQPANREVERQLELQMEAERNRRKQLLDTQAQVNVAEGHKQRVILESEGHLVAKANEAEATYNVIVREAEARNKQSIFEASALAQQINELASSLTSSPDISPSPSQRQTALQALLALRRLEQLKAIADGQGNSTYFFGDKASLGSKMMEEYGIDFAEKIKDAAQAIGTRVGNGATAGPLSGSSTWSPGGSAIAGAREHHTHATDMKPPNSPLNVEASTPSKDSTEVVTKNQRAEEDGHLPLSSLAVDAAKLVEGAGALADKAVAMGVKAIAGLPVRNLAEDMFNGESREHNEDKRDRNRSRGL